MFKKFVWIIGFVAFFMLNQITFADSAICKESLHKMVQSLNLDASQKAKIKPILDQLKSDLKASGSQMKDLHAQIKEQTNSDNMDQAKVDGLVDNESKLIGDMIKAKIKAKNQIYAILNPQQKTKLQDMVKKAEDKIAAEFKNCTED